MACREDAATVDHPVDHTSAPVDSRFDEPLVEYAIPSKLYLSRDEDQPRKLPYRYEHPGLIVWNASIRQSASSLETDAWEGNCRMERTFLPRFRHQYGQRYI